MNSLTDKQREQMYSKRTRHFISISDLAAVLNCRLEDMVSAQMGKPVPSDVHNVVIEWLEEKK